MSVLLNHLNRLPAADRVALKKVFSQLATLTATVNEINVLDGIPAAITLAAAAGGANVCEVTATVKDAAGVAVTFPVIFDIWLSDATTGAGLTGTTASGTVTAKAASGEVIGTLTSKKALRVQTKADGTFILEITDSAKTAFKVCAGLPAWGKAAAVLTLATDNYGS